MDELIIVEKENKFCIYKTDVECSEYTDMDVYEYRQFMIKNFNAYAKDIRGMYGIYIKLFFNSKEDITRAIEYLESCIIMNRLATGHKYYVG